MFHKATTKPVLLAILVALLTLAAAPAFAQLEVVTNNAGNPNPLDAECVHDGEYGMRIATTPGDASAMFVEAGESVGFNDETLFRAQFWFRPSDMDIRLGRKHFLMAATPGTTQYGAILGIQSPFRLAFFKNTNTLERKVNLNCKANCPTPGTCPSAVTTKLNLGTDPTQWSLIQVEWGHNTPGSFDGTCRISILEGAGAGQSAEVGLANRQYSINSVRMGFSGGAVIDPQSNGKHCYDDFQSFRTLAP